MKRIVLPMLSLFSVGLLYGDMKYDPATDTFFSLPRTKEVDQHEYERLVYSYKEMFVTTFGIARVIADEANNGQSITQQEKNAFREWFIRYLKNIGTPTALRLIQDIRKNTQNKKKNRHIESLLDY